MKTFVIIIAAFFSLISCGSQIYLDPVSLNSAIEKREFNFNATNAYPTSGDVIGVMNAMPGAMASRMLRLDPGYGFNLKKDLLSVYLPYFGRAYTANPGDATNGGLRFESKDFTVKPSTTKKGNTLLIITPNDQKANFVFNLEIFKNGSAFLSINSNDRQPISFDGNISVD
jgi:hypothetical protein